MLRSARRWHSAAPPEKVWATILDFGSYRSWWPWLVAFDPPPLATGASTQAVVRAPAGYRLRLRLHLADIDAPRRAHIVVSGDLRGAATVSVDGGGDGTEVGLDWALAPHRPLLRTLWVVARPVLARGHDWILDDGLRRCVDATGLDLITERATTTVVGDEGDARG